MAGPARALDQEGLAMNSLTDLPIEMQDWSEPFQSLADKPGESDRRLAAASNRNTKLVHALVEARRQIAALKEEVDKLSAPPATYGVYFSANDNGTVNVLAQGRKAKVQLHPSIEITALKPGQEVVLNEALNVVAAAAYEIQGDVVILFMGVFRHCEAGWCSRSRPSCSTGSTTTARHCSGTPAR
jgi:proteasome-associated ATPase